MNTQPNIINRSGLQQRLAETWLKIRGRFNQLSPRDRLALTLLGGVVSLLLVIYGMILPAIHYHDNARQSFQDQQALFYWLKQQQPAVQALAVPSASPAVGNPLTLVNTSAKDHALKITRLQPENNGSLRVWMEDVSFENTLRWLDHLQSRGLVVREITVDQQQAGLVSVRVVF